MRTLREARARVSAQRREGCATRLLSACAARWGCSLLQALLRALEDLDLSVCHGRIVGEGVGGSLGRSPRLRGCVLVGLLLYTPSVTLPALRPPPPPPADEELPELEENVDEGSRMEEVD